MSPTANNTSPSKASAAKSRSTTKRTTAKRPVQTTNAPTRRSPARSTTTRRGATTTRRSAHPRVRGLVGTGAIETVGSYAERAVLIPVGAALIARDKLVASVEELPRDPSSVAQEQLRKFERRGNSARNSLEREARRTRVRLERELRRRRKSLDRAVGDLDKRRGSLSRSVTGQVEEASTQIERTVQARLKGATSLAGKVQERFKDLA